MVSHEPDPTRTYSIDIRNGGSSVGRTQDPSLPPALDSATSLSSSPQFSCAPTRQHRRPYFLRICIHLMTCIILLVWSLVLLPKPAVVRGAFCNNTGISAPYQRESVSSFGLFGICFGIPFFLVAVVELLFSAVRSTREGNQEETSVTLFNKKLSQTLVDLYKYWGTLAVSLNLAFLLTNALKAAVGSLRPHFLDVCKPDWSQVACKDPTSERYVYVDNFHCTGDPKLMEEARRSFPSGHSSCTVCGMLFGALYLHFRFSCQGQSTGCCSEQPLKRGRKSAIVEQVYSAFQALVPFLQAIMLLLALYIPATRIRENFHHGRDVAAGMAIGVLSTLYGFFLVLNVNGR
uniref:Lipid phosphate phosphatase 1 n=1 Tax=Eimeria tenella TaxID=5802 RepID=A0A0A7H6F4_EIMTE|nr:lipid phosphate phosphatase 1 [Eimeria tenella]